MITIPTPECFGDLGGIPLLFTTIGGDPPAGTGRHTSCQPHPRQPTESIWGRLSRTSSKVRSMSAWMMTRSWGKQTDTNDTSIYIYIGCGPLPVTLAKPWFFSGIPKKRCNYPGGHWHPATWPHPKYIQLYQYSLDFSTKYRLIPWWVCSKMKEHFTGIVCVS